MSLESKDKRLGYFAILAVYFLCWVVLFVTDLLPTGNNGAEPGLVEKAFLGLIGAFMLGTPLLFLFWGISRIIAVGVTVFLGKAAMWGLAVVVFALLLATGGKALIFVAPTWAIGYRLEYNVNAVRMLPQPHDCDFLTAPIGSKHCHYEAQVEVLEAADERPSKQVVVSWRRNGD